MADSVSWCGRLSPCLRVQPWPPEPEPEPEPDPGIERLLALCSSSGSESQALLEEDADASQSSSASEEILSNQDLTLDKALIARDLLGECDPPDPDLEPAAKRPCRAPPEPSCAPDDPGWRRSVSVGADHQAELPALCRRRPARPGAVGDRLVWDPSRLTEQQVERYQRRLRHSVVSAAGSAVAAELRQDRLPDHEQALVQLQTCGHDVEEAARRVSASELHPAGRLSHWSESECAAFEEGVRRIGKDFGAIQRQLLPTRSVAEIVNFYYLWKKTERHRQFLSVSQLNRRKYGPDSAFCEPPPAVLSAAASSLQILMAADPWEHGAWAAAAEPPPPPPPPPPAAGLAGLLTACPQLLLP